MEGNFILEMNRVCVPLLPIETVISIDRDCSFHFSSSLRTTLVHDSREVPGSSVVHQLAKLACYCYGDWYSRSFLQQDDRSDPQGQNCFGIHERYAAKSSEDSRGLDVEQLLIYHRQSVGIRPEPPTLFSGTWNRD